MRNCSNDISDVRYFYNEFFQKTIWGGSYSDGESWFEDVVTKLQKAFPDQSDCDLPEEPDRDDLSEIEEDESKYPPNLRDEIRERIRVLADWARDVTAFATCVQDDLSEECQKRLKSRYNKLTKANEQVMRLMPDEALNPITVCGNGAKWLRNFHAWGLLLADWENAAYKCVHGKRVKILQVTPPPWPPWSGFKDENPDTFTFVETSESASAIDADSIGEFSRTFFDHVRDLASRGSSDQLKAFPHGLTELDAELAVEGVVTLKLTLKGPSSPSGS